MSAISRGFPLGTFNTIGTYASGIARASVGRFDPLERKIDQIIMQTTPRRSPRTKKH